MARRKHRPRRLIPPPPRRKRVVRSVTVTFNLEGLLKEAKYAEEARRYLWDYDSAMAYERSRISEKIRSALMDASEGPFEFQDWQRVVKWRYSLSPLSPAGSLKSEGGGRFNYSEFNPTKFPPFPALYLAEKRETAMCETLGQSPAEAGALNPFELALTNAQSVSIVSVRGRMDTIIDLRHMDRLKGLVELIKDFKIPQHVIDQGTALGQKVPPVVSTLEQLRATLTEYNWRWMPILGDVPASCQNFGQMVMQAGISGILYESKLDGGLCLAGFPQNFQSSFVEIQDAGPEGIVAKRLDANSLEQVLKAS